MSRSTILNVVVVDPIVFRVYPLNTNLQANIFPDMRINAYWNDILILKN